MTSVKREMATGSSKPQATPRACRWRVKIGHKVRCCHSWCGTGMTLRSSLGARRYWAGGYTAGTLLVPYSMAVESLSNEMRRRAVSQGGFAEDDIRGHLTAAAGTSIVVTFLGLQPIEKKMTMDQMLERAAPNPSGGARRNPFLQPAAEIAQYTRMHGIRALYAGTVPLLLRELCYISSITVVNPIATRYIEGGDGGTGGSSYAQGTATAFLVGGMAGLASAPFQTLSAVMKSEANRGRKLPELLKQIFSAGPAAGMHRLWFGAATRSVRTGFAGCLYYGYRKLLAPEMAGDNWW